MYIYPQEGLVGTTVQVSGYCYQVRGGGEVDVYFDTLFVFRTIGDALGGYFGQLVVPGGAAVGEHAIIARDVRRVVDIGRATFRVLAPSPSPTATATPTATWTATSTPTITLSPTVTATPFKAIIVHGLIYDADVGSYAGIAGAHVEVHIPSLGLHSNLVSNGDGYYRVEYRVLGHPPGASVHTIAIAPGYLTGANVGHLDAYVPGTIQVVAIDVGLQRILTITPTPTVTPSPTVTPRVTSSPTTTRTPTVTQPPVGTPTITPTASVTPTGAATLTSTSTRTPRPTVTGTPPALATILGDVQLQGRPTPPHPSWATALTISLYRGRDLTYRFSIFTDTYGKFALSDIMPGAYRVLVKNPHTLAFLAEGETLVPGVNMLSLGPLLEGDANNDNAIDILDFSLLRALYGSSDARADFNQDGIVDIMDFSLFRQNFGRQGDVP